MTSSVFFMKTALAAILCCTACGGTSGSNAGTGGSGARSESGGANGSGGARSDSGSGGATASASGVDAALAAAHTAATTDASCTAVPPFYWEIGDVTQALRGESVGGNRFAAGTDIEIASASKWIFGAYVVERFKDDLSSIDDKAMTMRSGYVSLDYASCVLSGSVKACFEAGTNSNYTMKDDGLFDYNGGHFQKYAVDLGLGDDDNAALGAEMQRLLGSDVAIGYRSPQLAGGVHTSASAYGLFLRKILGGKLAIGAHLGENAVCTLPGTCDAAAYSPATPEAWHYSYGHWVEDDPMNGDGSFSSPGAFGFYPFIDATKKYYGVLARYSLTKGAYVDSAKCGRVIRDAFFRALGTK